MKWAEAEEEWDRRFEGLGSGRGPCLTLSSPLASLYPSGTTWTARATTC